LRRRGSKLARIAHLAVQVWPERRRQRTQLLALTPERLRDIGVSRAAALREAGKPFWR
jgi:uncharacterized protein YjiS (DUF1127 family)